MKTFKNSIKLVLMVTFMALALVACGSDDDDDKADNGDPTMNIVETAVADGRFTTLVAALEAAELDDDLAGDGPFTVFAPTDDAFALLGDTVDELLQPENKDTLIDILTFHVYSGDVRAADVAALSGTAATMLNNKDLRIDVIDSSVILSFDGDREAMVIITDILATNGVIHVIDVVLNPADATQDIVDTAVANGNFTTLVQAVTAAELVDALKGEGPLTVFAPTDDAFALLGDAVAELLKPENKTDLIDLLLYHVYEGSVLAADAIALDGMTVDMFNGAGMSIDVDGGKVVLNWAGTRPATVEITNVLCSNGTIHVIDAVLNTEDAP